MSQQIPLIPREGLQQIGPAAIDRLLREVVTQAPHVSEPTGIRPPYLLGVTLRIQRALTGVYPGMGGLGEERTPPVAAGEYRFPFLEVDDLVHFDRILNTDLSRIDPSDINNKVRDLAKAICEADDGRHWDNTWTAATVMRALRCSKEHCYGPR